MFSPSSLTYSVVLGGRVSLVETADLDEGIERRVTIIDLDGQVSVFSFAQGSAIGGPAGEGAAANIDYRLRKLDANGDPTSGASPVYYEFYMEGRRKTIRYSASTQLPVGYRTATGRYIDWTSMGLDVVRSGLTIRQIRTATDLVDIVVPEDGTTENGTACKYTISIYPGSEVGDKVDGLYTLQNDAVAHTTITFENPAEDKDNDFDALKITRSVEGTTYLYEYEYTDASKQWRLGRGEGLPYETMRSEFSTESQYSAAYRSVPVERKTREIREADGTLVSSTSETVATLDFSSFGTLATFDSIKRTVATAVRTDAADESALLETVRMYYTKYDTYVYSSLAYCVETGNPGAHQRLHSERRSDGSWTMFDYDWDGRTSVIVRPWKDQYVNWVNGTLAALPDAAEIGDVTRFLYSSVDSNDSPEAGDSRPRTIIREIAGTAVERTYCAYYENASEEQVEIVERAATSTAAYGASGNLRTTRTYYAPTASAASAGRPKSLQLPDGRLITYVYEAGTYTSNATPSLCSFTAGTGDAFRTTTTVGTVSSPAGIANRTTRSTAVEDEYGNKVLEETYVYDGTGYERIDWTVRTFDERWRVTGEYFANGTSTASQWGCCQRSALTGVDGTEWSYAYDELARLVSTTKECGTTDIETQYTYDGANRRLSRSLEAGALSLAAEVAYDLAGRPIRSQTPDQLLHLATYDEGNRIVSMTYPGGGTGTVTRYSDGRIKSATGTAVADAYFDYGVDSTTGQQWSVAYGGEMPASNDFHDIPMWTKTWTDALGRPVRTEKPTSDASVIYVSQAEYNDLGQLVRISHGSRPAAGTTITPLRADILFEYDGLGQPSRVGLDTDSDGALVLASADRITDVATAFDKDASNDWWMTRTTHQYWTEDDATATDTGTSRTRLTGLGTAAPTPYSGILAAESRSEDIDGNETVGYLYIDVSSKTLWDVVDSPFSDTDAVVKTVNGLVVKAVSSTGVETNVLRDALGRVVGTTVPRISSYDQGTGTWSNVRTIHYSSLGQVDWTEDTAGNRTSYSYDDVTGTTDPQRILHHGRAIAVTDALNKVRRYSYNVRGQVERVWGDAEYPLEMAYDEQGNLASLSTFRGGTGWNSTDWPTATAGTADVTGWTYESATGLLAAKTYADSTGPTYEYDAIGRLSRRTWARNVNASPLTTDYAYDTASGELTGIDYSDATPDVTFAHDRTGRTTRITDAMGTRTLSYSATGKLASEILPTGFCGSGVHLDPSYDTLGRYNGYSLYVGGTVAETSTHGFDSVDRYASIVSGSDTFGYTYVTDTDLPLTTSGPANMLRTAAYEQLRNVVASIDNTVGGTSVSKFEYAHDELYRRTHAIASGSAFSQATLTLYSHDDRSELTGAKKYLGTDVEDLTSPITTYDYSFSYDPIGNRDTSSTAETGTAVTTTYTPDQLNQYTSIVQAGTPPITITPSNDSDGNQTTLDNATGNWALAWDAENRLIEAVSDTIKVECVYDYASHRVEKRVSASTDGGQTWTVTETRRFLYDGWTPVAEFTVDGGAIALERTHLWGTDLSGTLEGAGGIGGLLRTSIHGTTGTDDYYPVYDANGNVSEYVDGEGNVVAHYEYGPYGETTMATGAMAGTFAYRLSTKYRQAETGLYYYGYRHHDPRHGRWMSRDPLQEQGGTNLYAYCQNGPVSTVDPIGLDWLEIVEVHGRRVVRYVPEGAFGRDQPWFDVGTLDDDGRIAVFGSRGETVSLSELSRLAEKTFSGIKELQDVREYFGIGMKMVMALWIEGPSQNEPSFHQSVCVGRPFDDATISVSWGITSWDPKGHVYQDGDTGGEIEAYAEITLEEWRAILDDLKNDLRTDPDCQLYGSKTCRTYSQDRFQELVSTYGLEEETPPKRRPASRTRFRMNVLSTSSPTYGGVYSSSSSETSTSR
jgi:RHS repeat-associated protein